MGERLARKVLLIGWDAADWKIIQPLLDRDRMPTLKRLIEGGVMGNLATLQPILSPMLWTSIATGKHAHKHGILGFIEPTPTGVRPAMSTSRRCKAVWNLLQHHGLKSQVIGWFAGHPAEPIDGVCVTEFYAKAPGASATDWPLPPRTVHPSRLTETLAALRVHPSDFTLDDFLPFVPDAARIDQTKHRQLTGLAKILAEAASIQAAATWTLENEPWDFAAVYFDAIDHFCHRFMAYHPPRLSYVAEEEFRLFSNIIYAAYCFHDLMLARLLELAGEDTTVIIVSDHGYHSDHLRPALTPAEPAGPEIWHRPYGICVMHGPHIKRDELLFGATLLDVTPTILTLFGLPVGDDMDGKPWLQALDHEVTVERIPSWEDLPGECGMHPPGVAEDPYEAREMLQQLIDLGYVDDPGEDARLAAERATLEGKNNLARALMHARLPTEALPLFEMVHAAQPARLSVALNLANCYHALGRTADCRRLVDAIAAGQCAQDAVEGHGARILPQVDILRGLLDANEGRTEEALGHLRHAEASHPNLHGLHQQIGHVYLTLQRWLEAEAEFRRELTLDPDSAATHDGLALALLNQQRNQEAADAALTALGLLYHQPRAHYHLAIALARLGRTAEARQALELCLAMAPKLVAAKDLLELLRQAGNAAPRFELVMPH